MSSEDNSDMLDDSGVEGSKTREEQEKEQTEEFMDLFEEGFLSFLAGLVYSPLPFVVVSLFAILLKPASMGAFYFIYTAAYLFRRPVDGVFNTMRKRGSESGNPVGIHLTISLLFALGYLIVSGGLIFIFSDELAALLFVSSKQINSGLVSLLGMCVLLLGIRLQDSIGNPSVGGWLLTIRDLVFVFMIVAGIYIQVIKPSVYLIAYGCLSAVIGILAIYDAGVQPQVPTEEELYSDYGYMRWEVPVVLATRSIGELPTIILGLLFGGILVSSFESAFQTTIFISVIAITIADPLLLEVSNKRSKGELIDREISNSVAAVSVIPVVSFVVLFSSGPVLVQKFFTSNTTEVWILALILVIGQWAFSLRQVFSRSLRGAGEPRQVSEVVVRAAVASVGIYIIAAILGKTFGVAVAFLLLNLMLAYILGVKVLKEFNVYTFFLPIISHILFSAVLTIVASSLIRVYLEITNLLELGVLSVISIVLFFVFVLSLNRKARDSTLHMIQVLSERHILSRG